MQASLMVLPSCPADFRMLRSRMQEPTLALAVQRPLDEHTHGSTWKGSPCEMSAKAEGRRASESAPHALIA